MENIDAENALSQYLSLIKISILLLLMCVRFMIFLLWYSFSFKFFPN